MKKDDFGILDRFCIWLIGDVCGFNIYLPTVVDSFEMEISTVGRSSKQETRYGEKFVIRTGSKRKSNRKSDIHDVAQIFKPDIKTIQGSRLSWIETDV